MICVSPSVLCNQKSVLLWNGHTHFLNKLLKCKHSIFYNVLVCSTADEHKHMYVVYTPRLLLQHKTKWDINKGWIVSLSSSVLVFLFKPLFQVPKKLYCCLQVWHLHSASKSSSAFSVIGKFFVINFLEIHTGSAKKMYTHFNERKLYVVC